MGFQQINLEKFVITQKLNPSSQLVQPLDVMMELEAKADIPMLIIAVS